MVVEHPKCPSHEDMVRCFDTRHHEVVKRLDSSIHSEVKRLDEKYDHMIRTQCEINDVLFRKIDSIGTKMNYLLGAVAIIWPMIQLFMHYVMDKGKP